MTSLTPRPGILDINPYVGGNAGAEDQQTVINIASNESPLGPSRLALDAYRQAADNLHLYPDGDSFALRSALARRHGLPLEQIVCGAGSDELLTNLARAYAGPGDEIIYSAYGFMMYPIIGRSVGATLRVAPETDLTADVDAILNLASDKTKIVYLANPNNPTGSYLGASEIERLRDGLPETALLVLDAAYAEYVTRNDYEPGAALVDRHPNVVMSRTFSKIYGLAALRVGWVFAPEHVADILNRIRGPFNMGTPAIVAAAAAVDDTDHTVRSRALNDEMLPWFTEQCRGLGLEVPPSVGNFILVRFGDDRRAASVYSDLLAHGIRARAMGGYGLADSLRFSIGTTKDMATVADVLRQAVADADRR